MCIGEDVYDIVRRSAGIIKAKEDTELRTSSFAKTKIKVLRAYLR